MSIINPQMLAKVGYAVISIAAYSSVNPLAKKMDEAAEQYLPESWIKWIPTSYIAKAILIGGSAFGMHKLQTWSQPIQKVPGAKEIIREAAEPVTLKQHVEAVIVGVRAEYGADGAGLGNLNDAILANTAVVKVSGDALQLEFAKVAA